jgi:hypothetical protein
MSTDVNADQQRRWATLRGALDDIRERRLKALVLCPSILGWLRPHPDYHDLLFNAPPSKVRD